MIRYVEIVFGRVHGKKFYLKKIFLYEIIHVFGMSTIYLPNNNPQKKLQKWRILRDEGEQSKGFRRCIHRPFPNPRREEVLGFIEL